MKQSIIFIIIAVSMLSCKADRETIDDKQAPVIQTSSPSNNQEFKVGQTIPILMNVVDNGKIYVVHTHISDLSTGQLLKDVHRYPDQNSYSVNENFDATSKTDYRIVVIARDTGGNESNVSLTVTAK